MKNALAKGPTFRCSLFKRPRHGNEHFFTGQNISLNAVAIANPMAGPAAC
jgi:hypothetical protein